MVNKENNKIDVSLQAISTYKIMISGFHQYLKLLGSKRILKTPKSAQHYSFTKSNFFLRFKLNCGRANSIGIR